ncbi:MAG: HPr family phosphocarrier protein [Pseudomonadota bacterium]
MLQKDIEIINKLGLHARAAAKLVKLASGFDCEIEIQKESQKVNAKSIMGVMMLAAGCGNVVTITAEGTEETTAMEAVEKLFNDKFGEPE